MKRFLLALAVLSPLTGAAVAQTRGGTITSVLHTDPTGLSLAFPANGSAQFVASKISEGLVDYSEDLKPRPSLAKSWTVSDDGLRYEFKLQSDVKWSDGKPFSSADVVFSLAKMLPETSVGAREALREVASVEAPDPDTVVVTLKKPVPYFLMSLPAQQVPMMPKHIYEGTDFLRNPANAAPIGTGPFKLDQWRRGSFIRLVRNPLYWKADLPRLDAVVYRIIPDASSRAIALETGQIQVASSLYLSSVDTKTFAASKNFDSTSKGWEYLSQMSKLEVNWRRPPLNDVRVRQAMYYAIDRKFIVDRIWEGLGKVATGPISSKIPFYTKNIQQYDFDPTKAKALLEEAGYKADASGARSDATGARLKLLLLNLPGDERYARLAEYLREAWQAVGIEVTLQITDTAGWENRLKNWDFDVAITNLSQFGDPGLGIRRYYDSGNIRKGTIFTNTSGYSNSDVDAWFAEAAVEMKPAKRAELYAKIQRKLAEDVAMIWLFETEYLTISDKKVHGIISSAYGPRGSWDEAWIEK
jgi:peptide/nickel transport system substrate-binding protein